MAKRLLDLLIVTALSPLVIPVMFFVALMVRAKLGSPVFFIQERIGCNDRPFLMVKFRTMSLGKDEMGRLLPDSERLTRFGRFLRSSSLDELPELWNVLKGDMSLVGPRPLLPEYLPLYNATQRRRHDVMPGITGWSQINGRNAISWEDKLEKDVWYVDHRSLLLDCRILIQTIIHLIRPRGVNSPGEATMPRFSGSDN